MTGYMVADDNGRYLDASRELWIRHGIRRGAEETPYVHTADDLLGDIMENKASWLSQADKFYPAKFNETARNSQVTGDAMSFFNFLAAQFEAPPATAAATA